MSEECFNNICKTNDDFRRKQTRVAYAHSERERAHILATKIAYLQNCVTPRRQARCVLAAGADLTGGACRDKWHSGGGGGACSCDAPSSGKQVDARTHAHSSMSDDELAVSYLVLCKVVLRNARAEGDQRLRGSARRRRNSRRSQVRACRKARVHAMHTSVIS